jgi:hypothetical protein
MIEREELLLVLASGDRWVGFPWDRVDRVSLAADAPLPSDSGSHYSLATLLGITPAREEGFAIQFSHDGGRAVLTCERVGDLLPVQDVGPEVDRVLWPAHLAGTAPPGWEPLEVAKAATLESGSAAPGVEESSLDSESALASGNEFDREPSVEVLMECEPELESGREPEAEPHPGPLAEPSAEPLAGPLVEAWTEEPRATQRRALVAVRYLPARISVCRTLRQLGWSVEEVADLDRAADKLGPGSFSAVFVDVSQPLPTELRNALYREDLADVRWIAVGSRLRVVPEIPAGALARAPRLFFPFGEEEARELIVSL